MMTVPAKIGEGEEVWRRYTGLVREGWHVNAVFSRVSIFLDGCKFMNCTFMDCTIIWNGQYFEAENCHFDEGCTYILQSREVTIDEFVSAAFACAFRQGAGVGEQ